MVKSTLTEETQFKLPKDTPLSAVLNAVEEKTFPYKKDGKDLTFTKWAWEFEVVDGPYAGLRAWLDTEPRLTTHPENKVREVAEALIGATFELGQDLDTDDLLGLPCEIVCDHKVHEKKDGSGNSYLCPVVQVWPIGTGTERQSEEAPF